MDKKSGSEIDHNNHSQGWQKVDARVLGQILAAQNILFALPDATRIAEFYAQTLISIPGIIACRVCLGGGSVQAGELKSNACEECRTSRDIGGKDNTPFPADSNFRCSLADQPEMRTIPIHSYQHHFGFFVSEVENAAVFDAYHPFIRNLSDHVALILENRLQRDWLQKAHDELERRVEVRTQDLVSANASLQEEIEIRRQAENALSESEERFRSFVEKANDIVYTVSPDGVFTYVSPNWKEMLGHETGEVEGGSFENFVHPDDLAACHAILNRTIVSGEKLSGFEYRVRHKNGGWQWHTSNASVIRDADGKIVSFLGIARNITERKQAEEEIRKLNRELEQRVVDRTAQLEAANKELEAFAYSVSHDLRAPLRHINGFIGMLQNRMKNILDDQNRHYMDMIADSANKMGTLIDDLLSFSRMGRAEILKSQVNLEELMEDVIQDFKVETEGRNIEWQIANLPKIIGDRAMLRVALVNLISNALKFTRPRKIAQIEIGCERKNGTEVVIFVRDNGVGFDMIYADKLFGVFQRLHRQEDFEGTGIGLANVRRVISRHGGRTWVESQIDHGATFYFSIPTSK